MEKAKPKRSYLLTSPTSILYNSDFFLQFKIFSEFKSTMLFPRKYVTKLLQNEYYILSFW